jgi:hypothetical protein
VVTPGPAADPGVLAVVPHPTGDSPVVVLSPLRAGGLTAVRAEWGVDGGVVVLTGRVPFADVTGRAAFRSDGSLEGTVELRADVGIIGPHLGEVSWKVEGWAPEQPLAVPAITVRGTTLGVDLRTLAGAATFTPREGVEAARTSDGATIHLPGDSLPPGEPLSPRVAEVYRGLLGVDTSRLRVHAGTPVADAPAFVTDTDLFFAPGIYGVDSPETLRVLDAAIRAALTGLLGAVTGEPPPIVPTAAPSPAGPRADTSVVPAEVPSGPPASEVAEAAGQRTGETGAQATAALTGGEAGGPTAGTEADGIPGGGEADGIPAEGEADGTPAVAEGEAAGAAAGEAAAAPPPVELIMPEPPTELTPPAVARGGAVSGAAGGAAHAARALPSADADVADSRGAVTEPAAETAARAREELAAELGERPPPSPEIVALVDRIRTAIRENRPEDEDQLLETDPTHQAQNAGATITGTVQTQADQVGSAYDSMASPPNGTPTLNPTPIEAPSPTSPGMGVDAGSAAPDPIPPENTSLGADVAATDQRIADSGIDTRVTQEIPDGPFAASRDARGQLGEVAERTPQQIQAEQQQAIDTAQSDMAQLQLQAVAAMRASRSSTVGTVGGAQTGMVASEEQTRESVSAHAQRIYDDAQRQVDALLQPLSRTAITRWEAGLARLSQNFHDALARVKRWIDERHEGVGGTLLAIGDYFGGLPDWVTDEYNRAEREFGDGVGDLLIDISRDVNGVVAAAQAVVQHARDDIDAAFTAMEDRFPEWAAQERRRFSGMLDGLSQRVTDARTSFVRDVSQRATQAVNEIHAEAQARRDEASGLIGRVVAAIEEFIDDPIRAIINGLLRLVGIPPSAFWALVARIGQVISDIADDPENFINNLVAGLRQGFDQFFDNFGTHVLQGFWDWLFSGLETPIPMPRDFSAKSLLSFALQLMGITWPRVREILVRHIGPTAVEVIEAAWQLVSVLIERGPEGLVELVKEQLTPENLVSMILEAAVHYLVETLIQQVIVRVIGLLNPVGAIAQAIDLIYQVCSWVFRNAARIFRFVEAVVNGMADVVAGNIGGLAAAVERALASLIPPVIDFLAGLLHLGGLPGEVAEVITRLQTVVYAALDRIIGFLAERGRALLARMGIGGDRPGEGGPEGDTELGTTVRFTAAHESHRLYVRRDGPHAHLMVASTPATIPEWTARWRGLLGGTPPKPESEENQRVARTLLDALEVASADANTLAEQLAGGFENAGRDPAHPTPAPDDSALKGRERSIAQSLDRLFELFGEDDRAEHLQQIREALPRHGLERTREVVASWVADYIDPVEAKPLEGTQGKVWFAQRFSAEELNPTDVLGSGSQHVALLPYFEEKDRRGGAETSTFARYALTRTESPVRAAFFRSLGNRFAAQLREDGALRLRDAGDSDLLNRVRSIRYQASDTHFGSFRPWPDSGVSVLVEATVTTGGGILPTLRAFAQGRPVGGVTGAEFVAELGNSPGSRQWASTQLREAIPGKHEWIPVDLIHPVLSRVLGSTNGPTFAASWISLLENLRSSTDAVIFSIRVVPVTRIVRPGVIQEGGLMEVRAHAGSTSFDPAGRRIQPTFHSAGEGSAALTTGTASFHDSLRAFYLDNSSMAPAAWVDALLAHLRTIMYHGEAIDLPPGMADQPLSLFYTPPGGEFRGDRTVGQFIQDAAARWAEIEADFTRAKGLLP